MTSFEGTRGDEQKKIWGAGLVAVKMLGRNWRMLQKQMAQVLIDNRRYYCSNPLEAKAVARQVQQYFLRGLALPQCACVLDVGANIGLFTLEVKKRYPDAQVHAFEPAAMTATYFGKNCQSLSNVHLHQVALSDREGQQQFHYYRHVSAMSTLHPQNTDELAAAMEAIVATNESAKSWRWVLRLPEGPRRRVLTGALRLILRPAVETVRTSTLSAFLDRTETSRVDLLKIDVEGAELDVLRGVCERHWPNVDHVIAEVHDENGRVSNVIQMLTSQGLNCTVESDHQLEPMGIVNVLASRC